MMMNEVDKEIKRMMLNYPSIFPSRFACLRQLFLTNGNGMEWEEGRLVSLFKDKDEDDKMKYDDLLKSIKENDEEITKLPHDSMRPFYMSYRLRYEREMMQRKHIEENIDIYASEHVMGENDRHGIEWLKHISPQWICLSVKNRYRGGGMFPDHMLPEWAEAAEEIIKIAKHSLWLELGIHHLDNPKEFDESKVNPDVLEKYKEFCEIHDALDKFTSWKEKESKFSKIADDIIRKLKEEGN